MFTTRSCFRTGRGQFAVLGLPGTASRHKVSDSEEGRANPDKLIKRAYSFASSSLADEYVEFYIVMVRSGALTPRLFALSVGDKLWLSPKVSGLFTLFEVPPDKHVLLISTGTGLAPYMSILRSHLVCGEPRRFAVIHGARHSWDLGYRSELLTLKRMCPNFTYLATISRPEQEPAPWAGETGYIQDVWQRGVLEESSDFRVSPEDTHVFLCGNPSMIVTMENLLLELGFVVVSCSSLWTGSRPWPKRQSHPTPSRAQTSSQDGDFLLQALSETLFLDLQVEMGLQV